MGGGANIKSVKYHLRRTMGSFLFKIEEFSTLLSQIITACLNSTLLWQLSNDPSDLQVLTPGHCLFDAPLKAIPGLDVSEILASRLRRWQLTQRVLQNFGSNGVESICLNSTNAPSIYVRR